MTLAVLLWALFAWLWSSSQVMAATPSPSPEDAPSSEQTLELLGPPIPFDSAVLPPVATDMYTDLIGFKLQGSRFYNSLHINDYEMITGPRGRRYFPLLRTLKYLVPKFKLTPTSLVFSISPEHQAVIDMARRTVTTAKGESGFELYRLISDVTGKEELFVAEHLFADAFGFEYRWLDENYEYELAGNDQLYLFKLREERRRAGFDNPLEEYAEQLPVTEPVRQPGELPEWLSFVSVDLNARGRFDGDVYSASLSPAFTLYGQLLGGAYSLKLAQPLHFPEPEYGSALLWVDDALWSSNSSQVAVRVGDTSLGLNRLSVSSVNFSGVTVRGITSADEEEDHLNFLNANRFSFLHETEIEGEAPIGSRVEIYVNNRLLHDQFVESDVSDPLGEGHYRVSGIGLANRRINELKTVITYPDGTREERVEELVGNSNLLAAGQRAYTLGAGTKRLERDDRQVAEGLFVGGGYFWGLSDTMTLGLTGAFQDEFFPQGGSDGQRLPGRYYLSQSLAINWGDNLQFSQELGLNHRPDAADDADNQTPMALELALDYFQDHYGLSAYLFGYQPQFLNGITQLGDRLGYGLYGSWRVMPGLGLNSAFVDIRNDDESRNEQYYALEAISADLLPGLEVSLRHDQLSIDDDELFRPQRSTLTSLEFAANPWSRLKLEGAYYWGDPIVTATNEQLRYGIPVPMVNTSLSYGSRLSADYQWSGGLRMALNYRDSGQGLSTLEYALDRPARQAFDLDWSLRHRYNFRDNSSYSELGVEMPLDRRKKNAVGLRGTYNSITGDYAITLSLKLSSLFSWGDDGPSMVPVGQSITPQTGGLKGRVYLDLNADGHYQSGEPGVEDVVVLLNGSHKLKSGSGGYFYKNSNINQPAISLSLDVKSLDAIYTPTQGRQDAIWDNSNITRVNLGIAVLGSLYGRLLLEERDGEIRPLPGTVVQLLPLDEDKVVSRSITDDDGGYFLGELRPGEYRLVLEEGTFPIGSTLSGPTRVQLPASVEPVELEIDDLLLVMPPKSP